MAESDPKDLQKLPQILNAINSGTTFSALLDAPPQLFGRKAHIHSTHYFPTSPKPPGFPCLIVRTVSVDAFSYVHVHPL